MYAVEARLSDRLRDPEVIADIQRDLLNERNVYEVAGKNGWPHRKAEDAKKTLEESCGNATTELQESRRKFTEQNVYFEIVQLIRQITLDSKNRQQWTRQINKSQFEAIKFLNSIASAASGKAYESDHLIRVLHLESKKYRLPAYECQPD